MKDILLRIKLLKLCYHIKPLKHGIRVWYKDVWKRDLDAIYCCNGYQCGCQGITNREYLLEWSKHV